MPENDGIKLQKVLQEDKRTETKATSTLSVEGEIPCIVVYSDMRHVRGINHILNPLKQLLRDKRFKPVFLSDEIKPLEHYGKTFEQLAEECALGIVILDGLRPNVLLEFGILIGKKKPIIPLQDKNATVAVKSFYQQGGKEANLTCKQFEKLNEPTLDFFSHISDLQGLHVEIVNKDAPIEDPKYPANVVNKAIEKLRSRIIEEYNKQSLEQIGKISHDYLQEFYEVALKISEYYGGMKEFSVEDIENAIKKIEELERTSRINMPSKVYSTISSLYIFLAEKTEWKDVNKITDYYNRSIKIYERILKLEYDHTLKSQIQRKIGDIYWGLSQYLNKAANCKKAIKAYEEALKVYTLDRFPMDYAMTQNNLGNAYRTLAEVENKLENCKKAIKAYEEALSIFTEEKFPEIYPLVAENLKNLLEFCGGDK